MSDQTTASKKNSLGLILSWIFGILFLLNGITFIFSEPISGLIMLVMAAVLLPPVTKLINQKWKFSFSRSMKFVIITIGFLIFSATVDAPDVPIEQQDEPQKEEQRFVESEDIVGEAVVVEQEDGKQLQPEAATRTENEEKAKISEETKTSPILSETVSQKNAIKSAKAYLNYSAFSYNGLVGQLEYEQFSQADAVYGVDNSGADWNEQAAKKAQSYMKYSAFSRGGLISQLVYDGFTQAQAEYGVNAVGL